MSSMVKPELVSTNTFYPTLRSSISFLSMTAASTTSLLFSLTSSYVNLYYSSNQPKSQQQELDRPWNHSSDQLEVILLLQVEPIQVFQLFSLQFPSFYFFFVAFIIPILLLAIFLVLLIKLHAFIFHSHICIC